MHAPGLVLPDVELPPLASLDVVVSAWKDQRILSDAIVRGSGASGGSFEGTTDACGRFRARWLRPGRWRVRVSCEGYSSRRDSLDLAPGEERTIALGLLP